MRAKMCLYVHCENSSLYTFYIVSKRKQMISSASKVLKILLHLPDTCQDLFLETFKDNMVVKSMC